MSINQSINNSTLHSLHELTVFTKWIVTGFASKPPSSEDVVAVKLGCCIVVLGLVEFPLRIFESALHVRTEYPSVHLLHPVL